MRIEDVHAIQLKRAEVNHRTYKSIFESACDRIRRRAIIPNAPRDMLFRVPPFVWGRPPYAHAHAIRYVTEKLRRNGFKVSPDAGDPGTLHVDWNRKPAPREAAPSAPARAKGPKTVRFAEPPGPGGHPGDQPKLSARLAALRRQLT